MTEPLLLSKEDIQQRLGLDPVNVERAVSDPAFPAPAINFSQKARRWLASAVDEWVILKHQQANRGAR